MKRKLLTLSFLAWLTPLSAQSAADFELNTARPVMPERHEAQVKQVTKQLKKQSIKANGIIRTANDVKRTIDMAFYVHPFYLDQSFIATKTASSIEENGSAFLISRIEAFVSQINKGLEQSNINAEVNLRFVTLTGRGVPIISSIGGLTYTMPDGVTSINTDAEFFELLMQDWGTDSTRYGISNGTLSRRIKQTVNADINVFLRPHMDELLVTDEYAAKSIDSYTSIVRPLVDGPVGFGFDLSTMTVYDFYWQLGFQGIDPSSEFINRIATKQFGYVLQAGDENGSATSPYSYAKSAVCGSGRTVMGSPLSSSTLPFFSSPDKSFEGQPCGIAVGATGEADNRSVLMQTIPLVESISERESVNSSISISSPVEIVKDGFRYGISVERDGDLSKRAFVTLIAENSSAREGYIIDTVTGQLSPGADFHFGIQTIEFEPGSATASAQLQIAQRNSTPNIEQFFVKAIFASNATINPAMNSIRFAIEPNTQAPIKSDTVTIDASGLSVAEGAFATIPVKRTLNNDTPITVNISDNQGTVVKGINYNVIDKSITLAADQEVGEIRVEIFNDGKYERDMYFDVSIDSIDADIANGTLRVQIEEISAPNIGTVQSQIENVIVENNISQINIRLIRVGGTDESHSVVLKTGQGTTLAESDDYTLGPVVTFNHRETEITSVITLKTQNIGVINIDIFSENLQTTTGSAKVSIIKSDQLPVISVTENVTVDETAVFAPIFVNRLNGASRVTLTLSYKDETAKKSVDYKAEIVSVTLEVGELSKQVNIPIIDRTSVNGDRTFMVEFSSVNASLPTRSTSILIKDVVRSGGGDNYDTGKIDDYSGSFGFLSVLLCMLCLTRRTLFPAYSKGRNAR